MDRRHTDREYERELEHLREQVLFMGARVEDMIGRAMRAFSTCDVELARKTIEDDREIDSLEVTIDELCIRILARRQPVASDLRFITTTLKHVTDLERLGDLGVNISERVIEIGHLSALDANASIERIAAAAQQMLHDALDAFVAGDAVKAEQVLGRDQIVDAYYAQLFPELIAAMTADPAIVYQATRLQSVGKYLERIADHATNLAEMVVFMVRGKDIRHPATRPNEPTTH
jgi:phosphate transport system protein